MIAPAAHGPFRAFLTLAPGGVLSCAASGFQLWRANEWIKHRGGMRGHYADLRAGRTTVVDHLQFRPETPLCVEHDAENAVVGFIPLAVAFGLAITRDEGIDAEYLQRCFDAYEASRVMDAINALGRELARTPQAGGEASVDMRAGTARWSDDLLLIQ